MFSKLITPEELRRGYIELETDNGNVLVSREDLLRMTPDQAKKLLEGTELKDIQRTSLFPLFYPSVFSKEKPETSLEEKLEPFVGEQPEIKPVTTVITKPAEETMPFPAPFPQPVTKPSPYPEPQLMPQPVPLRAYDVKLDETTRRLKVAKIPKMSLEQEQEYEKLSSTQGLLSWRQGTKWVLIPPREDGTYNTEDMRYFDKPPRGQTKFATGKGSAAKTLQIIGRPPVVTDSDLDLGWASIHITGKGKELQVTFGGGSEAAKTRWDEEQAKMDELSRQAYQDLPQGTLTQKIRGTRIPKAKYSYTPPEKPQGIVEPTVIISPEKLNKVLIPEYSSEDLKVYAVDGNAIRNEAADKDIGNRKGIDFVQGGHYGTYWNLIPYNEVWIENNIVDEEKPEVIHHEVGERDDMLFKHVPYNEAHDIESEKEVELRKHPENVQAVVQKEIAEYEEKIRKQKETTDENSDGMRYVAGYYRKPKPVERRETPSNIVAGFKPKYYLGRRVRGSGLASSI
jgi:hypothetical protein